jgi:hypothetical protein
VISVAQCIFEKQISSIINFTHKATLQVLAKITMIEISNDVPLAPSVPPATHSPVVTNSKNIFQEMVVRRFKTKYSIRYVTVNTGLQPQFDSYVALFDTG